MEKTIKKPVEEKPPFKRTAASMSVLLGRAVRRMALPGAVMIFMNSLKTERAITTSHAFDLPNAENLRRPEKLHLWHPGNGLFVLLLV